MGLKTVFCATALTLIMAACSGATEPEPPYYTGTYQAVTVNGFDCNDLGIVFTVTFNEDFTADLRFQYRDADRPATGIYDEPDEARDSELRLNEPYTDVYQAHWSGDNPAQGVSLNYNDRDLWIFERVN